MSKHKNIPQLFFLVVAAILLSSCHAGTGKNMVKDSEHNEVTDRAKQGFTAGTVMNYAVDGCTWMIFMEDDMKLQPLNLTPEFQKNGLKVWIRYTAQKGAMSICMAGQPVNITEIKERK